mmetsp:Transcript_23238/g.35231  ORF Transcript_23238/g.35231 Transcript_23238/m.35231 type:complete len:269 (+) Transcript_23238:106-912(+)|eukprot:CAMPEP_0194249514 /NCGR_PEP_ID=MMETSP0158-20130606/20676_1 /TAXON_ID=33649 /ORGANISM="Thalassionema nitzschioides, Strain L26-B" /LENGTH=268 /DNA_ID=CAMNT_0038986047 /DNA_START=82 /DNA_END=888 /DNA_ORIENTATION=+
MRFLLLGRRLPSKHIQANTPLRKSKGKRKVFGQQYSPSSGSVLRLEANLDENDRVESATYFVKRLAKVISSPSSSAVPMFVECSCPDLHKLSKQVVAQLQGQDFYRTIRNSIEFSATRSSPAFRHVVMEKYNLASTEAYDLVEQTLQSVVKQMDLSPRNNRHPSVSYMQSLQESYQPLLEQAQQEEFVESYGRALRRVRKPRHLGNDQAVSFGAVPRSLQWYDSELALLDDHPFLKENINNKAVMESTWEAYVDGLLQDNEGQREVSA